jgi:ammonium transporter, Amt family
MEKLYTIHNLWMLLCTMMVFILHLGFASLEAGFTQAKNGVNILFKNTIIPVIGILSFAYIGYNIMYPGEAYKGEWFGFKGIGIYQEIHEDPDHTYDDYFPFWAFVVFKAMFAATAATIVSGSVAERIKFNSFIIFSTIYVTLCYPVVGMWVWGGGFLSQMDIPFYDFSGASVVHSVGGWAALAGTIILGPRIGRFDKDEYNFIAGHSMPLAAIGIFLLWFGWFGFNGGSVFSADPLTISLVLLNTAIAGSAGAIGSWGCTWILVRKHDYSMFITGILGSLVSSTASADIVSPTKAGTIGIIAGVLVVLSIRIFDKLKIDDPVRAVSAHLTCGIWGTLAVGIYGEKAGWGQLSSQLIGIGLIGAFSFGASALIFYLLKKTIGIRVKPEVELEGLDMEEHGQHSYHGRYIKW